MNIRNALRITADVVVIVAGLSATYVLWQRHLSSPSPPEPVKAYQAGEKLGNVPLGDRPSATTMLLVLNSRCRFCTESTPFYRRLVQARDDQELAMGIVAIGTESKDVLTEYLSVNRVSVDSIISIKPGMLKPVGNPTLILVDAAGRVLDSWAGMLDKRGERTVITRAVAVGKRGAGR